MYYKLRRKATPTKTPLKHVLDCGLFYDYGSLRSVVRFVISIVFAPLEGEAHNKHCDSRQNSDSSKDESSNTTRRQFRR